MSTRDLVLLVLPLVAIQLVLLVIAVRDLLDPDRRVRGGRKVVWALVIVFVNIVGPLIYLAFGREED